MRIEHSFRVPASQQDVWNFIRAPEKVGSCVPGCKDIDVVDTNNYRASVTIKVGPISANFDNVVKVVSEDAPTKLVFKVRGEEGAGASTVKAENSLTLTAIDDNETEVSYVSVSTVVGRLGKFAEGIMVKKAESIGQEFAANLCRELGGDAGSQVGPPADKSQPISRWLFVSVLVMLLLLMGWYFL